MILLLQPPHCLLPILEAPVSGFWDSVFAWFSPAYFTVYPFSISDKNLPSFFRPLNVNVPLMLKTGEALGSIPSTVKTSK
jgi:hypothetical protein